MMKEDNVPKWFNDFAVQNQKEHGELKTAIESGDGELKAAIESRVGELKTAIESGDGELKVAIESRVGELKAAIEKGDGALGRKIEKVKGDLTWRMVIMAGVTIGAIGLMMTLSGG